MNFLKKRSVAVIIAAAAILVGIVLGFSKAPAKLPDVQTGQWVYDGANVLSKEQEQYLTQGNAALLSEHGAVVAVATMKNVKGWDLWDFCLDLAEKWGLSAQDMILVLDIGGDNYWLVQGSGLADSFTDDMAGQYSRQYLENDFAAQNYGVGVISLFDALTGWYGGSAGQPGGGNSYLDGPYFDDSYYETPDAKGGGGAVGMLILVIVLIIVAVIIWDAARYNRYRRLGVGTTVVYRPLIFGRPRRPRTPPPPRPPRPPSGGMRPPSGGTRPPSGGARPSSGGFSRPSGGTTRPSGGFSRPSGGASRPSGGFSRPSGGTTRSSGGFSRPSGGGRSGGSFGGGRSGGSFGGGRSGGFGAGRR